MSDREPATEAASAPLGAALRRSRKTLALAAVVAALVVGCDLVLARLGKLEPYLRLPFPVLAVLAYGVLTERDWAALGFRWKPIQSWGYWLKFTAKLGAVIVFLFLVPAVLFIRSGRMPKVDFVQVRLFSRPSEFWLWAFSACLVAPLVEEAIYRLVLCPPCAAALGRRATVVVSGCVFGALHFAYGNPSPDNLIAGFILGWAFLKSGSLVVPIALHSLGNALVGAYHVVLCCLNV